MNKIVNIFRHLKTVSIHKFYVAKYCFIAGLYWQGVVHDFSKFSPIEFWESVKYYQGTRSPIAACKEEKGYSDAWLHHKGKNRHHYEYWQDCFDGGTIHLEMPYKYALEMLCDNIAANQVYNGNKLSFINLINWWNGRNEDGHVAMGEGTWYFMDEMFRTLARTKNLNYLKKSYNYEIYKRCMKKYS